VDLDPLLYLAFAIGFVAGQVIRPHPRWVPSATLLTVVVLVGLLGASLDAVPLVSLADAVPLALAFSLTILALTAASCLLLARWRPPPEGPARPAGDRRRPVLSVALLAALLVGLGVGRAVSVPALEAIPWVLYLLLGLVGFDITLRLAALRGVWVPLTAAAVGAVGAALVFAALDRAPLGVSLATSLGFGFYSLAGPVVLARAGAVFGLLAFLTNFFRENLTMLLSPYLGARLRGAGLTALGGATAMDTTLYFITRYGDPDAGSLALASGLVLTIGASLLVPAVLSLPL
jgi:uncharacterized membrane protein YbjE (DUF340 family)